MNDYRLDRALEFTVSMMGTRDLDTLLANITEIVMEDFEFEGCDAFVLDSEGERFILRASKGFQEVGEDNVGRIRKTPEELSADLDLCEKLGRFTFLYRAKPGDDPSSYHSLLHPEKAAEPRENPDDWHELDVLYILLEDEEGKTVGFLEPDGPMNGKIPSESVVRNLEVFAALASIAVANAEILDDLNRSVTFYKTLAKTTAYIQEPVDLEETLHKIADSLNEIVPFDEITVYLIDWGRNLMVPVYATGAYSKEVLSDIGPITGLAGHVAQSGQVEIVLDSMDDLRVEDVPGIDEEEVRQTMMAIPLKDRAGDVEGVLLLYRDKAAQFTVGEWEIAEPFAVHAAIALENAKLREELQEKCESAKRAFEEMKALDRAKDSLVNTISHELRTPLTTILGYLEMASEGLYGDIDPRLRERMTSMIASVNRINALVGKMLDMSRLQDGALKLDFDEVNLAMLTNEVAAELRNECAAKEHNLTVLFGNELPLVDADRPRIHDVLHNLLTNSIRYTRTGGQISVGADILGGKIHLWVRDNGRGISEEDKPKIFDRFFLTDMGLEREDGRVGIGLYVSKEIIRRHGGEMWFDSKEGEGSTFHFTLPLKQKKPLI